MPESRHLLPGAQAVVRLRCRQRRALAPSSASASSISGQGMFTTRVMTGVAHVASSVPRLVAMEMVERPLPAAWQRPDVAMMRIIAVVDMTVKMARSMEPGSGSNEHSARKPIGPIVAVGGTVVRGIVKVPVGTDGSWADVDPDGNLSRRMRGRYQCTADQQSCENCESGSSKLGHRFSLFERGVAKRARVLSPAHNELRTINAGIIPQGAVDTRREADVAGRSVPANQRVDAGPA